jgi:hypothetical protein
VPFSVFCGCDSEVLASDAASDPSELFSDSVDCHRRDILEEKGMGAREDIDERDENEDRDNCGVRETGWEEARS